MLEIFPGFVFSLAPLLTLPLHKLILTASGGGCGWSAGLRYHTSDVAAGPPRRPCVGVSFTLYRLASGVC